MRVPYHWILGVSLLAAGALVGSGCAKKEAPAPVSETAVAAPNLAPTAPGDAATAPETDREKRYRDAIRGAAVDNPAVAALIPRKPTMGGSWRVGSKEEVHFLGNGQVALDYEDGHVAGRLVVKVEDPHDPKSWTVVRDEPR